MTGIKKIIIGFLTVTVSGLMLTGCNVDMTKELRKRYTKEEAEDELKTGAEKMEEWIGVNCPNGKAVSMENSFCQLTGGPIFLTGFVEGEFSDGNETYDYLMNVQNGELYLDPGGEKRQEFFDECRSLVGESLGVDELIMDKSEYSNMSFVLSMGMDEWIMVDKADKPGAETNDKLKEGALGFWLTNMENQGYLPASLVLSDGDVKEFVRDKDRKDLIVVGMNVYVPEETDLSSYTLDNLESIEKEYGLYFERLILNTDKEQMDFNQKVDERNVSISKNEK